MKRQSTPRVAHVMKIISRLPPLILSSSGLSKGAMTANGAMVMTMYRSIFFCNDTATTEKNNDPASETVRQTSPQMLAACVIARRANGVGSAKRGSTGPLGERDAAAMARSTLSVTASRQRLPAEFIQRSLERNLTAT